MQVDMLDLEVYEMQMIKEEAMKKIIYSVEWHFECTGSKLPIELVFAKVDQEIEIENFIYNITDVFFDLALQTYEEICGELNLNEEE